MFYKLLFLLFILFNNSLLANSRIALVIGNSNYSEWGELDNPLNDAKDMKMVLENRGFEVLYDENIKRNKFEKLLFNFRNRLKENNNSVGVFYFSGHGMEIEGRNYLIPIDSKGAEGYRNIELNKIINDMQSTHNRLNIIILDACRDNPFIRRFKSFNRGGGFTKIEAPPRGLLIAYASEAGKTASDGDNLKNGLFTKYLLEYIKKPLPLYSVFRKTRNAVDKKSNHTQLPTIYDQTVGGDFFFTMPNKIPIKSNKSKSEIHDKKDISSNNLFDLLDNFKTHHIVFIMITTVGVLAIFITTITGFLYNERTDFILKSIAIFLTFLGSSGFILNKYLEITDNFSLLLPTILGLGIFLFILKRKLNQPETTVTLKPISLRGKEVLLLEDIASKSKGMAKILTHPMHQKLVKNISSMNYLKGDRLVILEDGITPLVGEKIN